MNVKTRLILNLHCHQPVGNFGWVFERATNRCYRPVLEAFQAHPGIKMVLHVSGPLLEWWEAHAADMMKRIRAAVAEERVELQTAGYAEPILPMIPARDRIAQIRVHRACMKDRFGVNPRSLWLTERVWEQSLVPSLCDAGVTSTVVDDHHFEGSGIRREDLDGYAQTESLGATLAVFPISYQARYLVPFEPVADVMKFLQNRHRAGQELIVYGDDAEKFGVWPKTYEHVFENGWLEQFLSELEAARGWLESTTYAGAQTQLKPARRVYFPSSSYQEMEEWCLPPKESRVLFQARHGKDHEDAPFRPYLRGAPWRNMLARYPEANRLYRRMLEVSRLAAGTLPAEPVTPEELDRGVRALLRSQCNCAYWHGVFGGLYLPFLRDAVVTQFLQARRVLAPPDGSGARATVADVDGDGYEELVLENARFRLWIAPHRNGVVEVFDDLVRCLDLVNVLGRYEEAYHADLKADVDAGDVNDVDFKAVDGNDRDRNDASPKVADRNDSDLDDADLNDAEDNGAKESIDPEPDREDRVASIHDLSLEHEDFAEELFHYDQQGRGAFAASIHPEGTSVENILDLSRPGQATQPMEFSIREGSIELTQTTSSGTTVVTLHKAIALDGETVRWTFRLNPAQSLADRQLLAIRSDFSLPAPGSASRCVQTGDGRRLASGDPAQPGGTRLRLVDERGEYEIESTLPLHAAVRPLITIARSEDGVTTSQQGMTLLLTYPLESSENDGFLLELTLRPIGA